MSVIWLCANKSVCTVCWSGCAGAGVSSLGEYRYKAPDFPDDVQYTLCDSIRGRLSNLFTTSAGPLPCAVVGCRTDVMLHIFSFCYVADPGFALLQLPVYVPSQDEQKDALLYANNVREYMVRVVWL